MVPRHCARPYIEGAFFCAHKGGNMRTLSNDTISKTGEQITLKGWINTIRKHGKIIFLDLRDKSGIVQTVLSKEIMLDALKSYGLNEQQEGVSLHAEDVIEIVGIVRRRPESMINPNLATGTVEIEVQKIILLNRSKELPIPIDTDGYSISEEMRLRYRYLDLRRERMHNILELRSKFYRAIREAFYEREFVEVETPLLTKSTKEGAKDFLVPSRFQPGKFYALPQSPQQYKQLLMTAGVERYFQMARCMRDEDLRADRGFEFTQLDMEMSFVEQEDVMKIIEDIVKTAVTAVGGKLKDQTFPIIQYKDALKTHGADKFDIRTEEEKKEGILAFAWVVNFPFFKKVDTGDAAEIRDGKSGWTFTHNPFSTPIKEHIDWHIKGEHIGQIVTAQYDLVCNGYEVGGGSIRAHQPEVLRATMKIMGYTDSEIQESIGHMLEAFELGTPPHGGIALGLDRLVMLLTQEQSLKETIAFPMTSTGRTAIMDAPSPVDNGQLEELGLTLLMSSQTSVFDRIVQDLKRKQLQFEVTEHVPVKTSEEAAVIRGVSVSTGAKAILLYADNKPIMVTVPGDKKIDMKAFKLLYQVKDLRMATSEEVEKVTTVQIGAVPPLGHIFSIPLYVDESLRQNEIIYFNPGLHTKTIAIKEQDYEKAANPIIGSFTK